MCAAVLEGYEKLGQSPPPQFRSWRADKLQVPRRRHARTHGRMHARTHVDMHACRRPGLPLVLC
eukprot:1271877-Pleurochrysis_carterae.AAC.1